MRKLMLLSALAVVGSLMGASTASASWGWSCSWGYHHNHGPHYCYYTPGYSCVSPCYVWPCDYPNCCYYGCGCYSGYSSWHNPYHYYIGSKATAPTRGTVIVNLPEDAKLIVDGKTTKLTSGRRVFVTPKLQKDKDYAYTLTAEVIRDGKTKTITQDIKVRAGRTDTVSLSLPSSATIASK